MYGTIKIFFLSVLEILKGDFQIKHNYSTNLAILKHLKKNAFGIMEWSRDSFYASFLLFICVSVPKIVNYVRRETIT